MMNSQHGQDVEPFLAASRSSDPTSRRSCGAIADLQLHTLSSAMFCLMAGDLDGKRSLSLTAMRSTSPASFVFWSIARRRAFVESRAATFARVRLAQRLDPIHQAV